VPDAKLQRAQVAFSVSSVSNLASETKCKLWDLPEGGWPALIESATRCVFETMLGCTVTRSQQMPPPEGDITAMVGLAGGLCGVLSTRCSLETASVLASKMLGSDTAEVESATRDALGEITNVVAGSVKTAVPGLEDTCFLSTPTVVIGHNFKVYSLGNSTTTAVPLEAEGFLVWIILDVHH
jgi:chemotaxis protein CheX